MVRAFEGTPMRVCVSERETDRQTESVCVCVCVCARAYVCVMLCKRWPCMHRCAHTHKHISHTHTHIRCSEKRGRSKC